MLRAVAALLLVAACVAWVGASLDLDAALEAVTRARWGMLAPMALAFLAAHLVRSHRLGILLTERPTLAALFRINAIGYMAISVMPLRLGELVRPHLLWQRHGLPLSVCVGAIAVERLLDLAGLVAILVGSVLASELLWTETLAQMDVLRAGWQLAVVVSLGALLLVAVLLAGRWLTRGAGRRAAHLVLGFREGLTGFLQRPGAVLTALIETSLVYAFATVGTWCVLLSFDGVPHDLLASSVVLSLTTIGMSAAPTPGSIGTFEASCLAALLLHGVDRTVAATVAIVLHASQLAFSLGLGSIAMLIEGMTLSEVAGSQRGEKG